ncbi:uncharacterized protein SPPG_09324 [Spizellomyces punctatus DAOM BR117]|uniref:Uncharacterized protein n=1 Tax=Spizellomyces punctatus (strain DAOM BR117) TaxID=645134 RepID=A0A0L0HCM6_SPIPD|nr:uncharacterized protein SPPG_09324 [Spizellomyces punctatus DAOM BR117]KNC98932.1 hypothetical protein SPPG_09324 [Spizellomyces punctatus DAOM BR117]|eukprot:XP_016606972.1 hypothetical protein SPPG_09324 [Spizellomyces punctatus DAOM BR117]
MMEIFMHAFACYESTTNDALLVSNSTQCFHKDFLPTFILSIPGILYLVLQVPITSLVFFPINPRGDDLHAKTTGRIDAIYQLFRIVLVVCIEIAEDSPAVVLAVLAICCFTIFYMTARQQPFFSKHMNDLRCGILFASFCSSIHTGVVYGMGGTDNVSAFVIICVLLVPEFACGFAMSFYARSWIANGVIQKLQGCI